MGSLAFNVILKLIRIGLPAGEQSVDVIAHNNLKNKGAL